VSKYTIISSTNRSSANSYKISEIYKSLLADSGVEASIIDLEKLPKDFVFTALYDNAAKHEVFNHFLNQMNECDKLIFVVPEYNGSFPGVLKAFIDGLDYPYSFKHKKAALVGHSAGTQGSALALSHLTDILNYLGTHVFALKPRMLNIDEHLSADGTLSKNYITLLKEQVEGFVSF